MRGRGKCGQQRYLRALKAGIGRFYLRKRAQRPSSIHDRPHACNPLRRIRIGRGLPATCSGRTTNLGRCRQARLRGRLLAAGSLGTAATATPTGPAVTASINMTAQVRELCCHGKRC
jgi:hypothetical protein